MISDKCKNDKNDKGAGLPKRGGGGNYEVQINRQISVWLKFLTILY